jgi:myo-inositol-1(or 4)-monophosphatase
VSAVAVPDAGALERIRATAETIAREAGEILKQGWGTRPTVRAKSVEVDLVTEYDGRAEAHVVRRLRECFPDHAIVGEEGTRIGGASEDALVWYVDPLDGTTNFAHGLPLFAVSIGLAAGREPLVGVVHAPVLGWTFTGARGGPALLNGEPIAPSGVERVERALLVTGFPYARDLPHPNEAEFAALAAASHGLRRLGSAALDLCFVACGWLDGYWERYIKPWDMVAGAAIVTAAGGRVTDLDGAPFDGETGRVLATNGGIHDELGAALARIARERGASFP